MELKPSVNVQKHVTLNLSMEELYKYLIDNKIPTAQALHFTESAAFIYVDLNTLEEFTKAVPLNVRMVSSDEVSFIRISNEVVKVTLPRSYIGDCSINEPKTENMLVAKVLRFTEVTKNQLTMYIHGIGPTDQIVYLLDQISIPQGKFPDTWTEGKMFLCDLELNKEYVIHGLHISIYFYREEGSYFFAYSDQFVVGE